MKISELQLSICGEVDTSAEPPHVACVLRDGHEGPHGYAAAPSVVTITCKTPGCPALGSWIRRTSDDLKKNIYTCESCKKPMVR